MSTESDPRQGEISWDCSPWAGETRRLLASLMNTRSVPHAWEGTVLVAPARYEELVDELVEEMLATAQPALDPDEASVTWEVSAWSTEAQNAAVDLLTAAHIAIEWDIDGDLVVAESDADAVEAILTDLVESDDDDADTGDEIDGMELHGRLDALFLAADRLARDPGDRKGAVALIEAAGSIEGVAVPFGMELTQWRSVETASAALAEAVRAAADGTSATHDIAEGDSVESLAAALRELLRQYV